MSYTAGMGWAWVRLGAAELHLFEKDDHDPATTAAAADLVVDDADEFERMLRATGVEGTSDPYDTSYGREVVHVDLDNNLMRFIAPRREHAELAAIVPAEYAAALEAMKPEQAAELLEDVADGADARDAFAELAAGAEPLPAEQVWAELGIDQ
jgi:hypothetical protein